MEIKNKISLGLAVTLLMTVVSSFAMDSINKDNETENEDSDSPQPQP